MSSPQTHMTYPNIAAIQDRAASRWAHDKGVMPYQWRYANNTEQTRYLRIAREELLFESQLAEAPYCDHGCGDLATVRLEHVGLCDDCAAEEFRKALKPLAGALCCSISRDNHGNLRLCLAPFGVEHLHG